MISIYTHRLDRGGAETSIVAVANLMASKGLNVDFVTSSNDAALCPTLSAKISRTLLGTSRTIRDIIPLSRYLKNKNPDAVISTLLRCNITLCAACVVARYKGSVVLRETTPMYERSVGKPLTALLLRFAYYLMSFVATRVIVPSASMLPGLSMLSTRYSRKAVVVPNVVRSTSAQDRVSRSNLRPRIIVVARLEPVKGVDLVISSLAHVNAECKVDIYGDGSLRAVLESQAELLAGGRHISFHGHVDDVNSMYGYGGVLISASHFEGFPNAIAEALVSGLGVIVVGKRSAYSDIATIFALEDCCFVETRCSRALAGRIEAAMKDASSFCASQDSIAAYWKDLDHKILDGYLELSSMQAMRKA